MADPFESLATPSAQVAPEPEFAARLRSRLERALSLPAGVVVSGVPTSLEEGDPVMLQSVTSVITPYIAVADARAAIDWYRDTLGAEVVVGPIVMPDGRIGHCELDFGGGRLMLSDAHPEIDVVAPVIGAGSAVSIHMYVADVDQSVLDAAESGATIDREPVDSDHGRNAIVVDPFGHRWYLTARTS